MTVHARLFSVLAGAFLVATPGAPACAQVRVDLSQMASTADRARIRGADTASVWLVIVGDFTNDANLAFQRGVWPTLDSLFVRPGRLHVAWVNLPGESKASQAAAEVAACAGSAKKFWAAHDVFLEDQAKWRALPDPTPYLARLAGLRGADPILMKECLQKHAMVGLLRADASRARGAGIQKSPGYILANKTLTNVRTAAEFRRVIEGALREGK